MIKFILNIYLIIISLALYITLYINSVYAFHNSHFYRASYLHGQTRFEKERLNTLDLELAYGNANCGYDICKNKVPLLATFGPENVLCLEGLNNIFPNLGFCGPLGLLNFTGRFSIVDFQATLYQNLCNGFFVEYTLPITDINLDPLAIESLSILDPNNPQRNSYINLISNLRSYLISTGLDVSCTNYTAVGDCTALLGWTSNYEQTEFLDFIDLTFKLGVLFPTSHKANLEKPFDIPNGYDGFWGIPVSADIAWGALDWFTFGLHFDAVLLLEKEEEVPLRNSICQLGFLRDKSACLKVDPGNVINISTYIKAEHFIFNLTWILGYTYSRKNKSILKKINNFNYSQDLVIDNINIDPIFRSWESHNINLLIEYDLSEEDQAINPYVGIFYNSLIRGKRVFKTNIFGGTLGINIAFCF